MAKTSKTLLNLLIKSICFENRYAPDGSDHRENNSEITLRVRKKNWGNEKVAAYIRGHGCITLSDEVKRRVAKQCSDYLSQTPISLSLKSVRTAA